MNEKLNVLILTESQIKKIITDIMYDVLEKRIPEIVRRANRKEILSSSDLKDLTGMSYRVQKYHRDKGNLSYSQDGRKIFYRTTDVEKFMAERRINAQ